MNICEIEHCKNPYHAKGYCRTHYLRWKRHSDPNHIVRKRKGFWVGVICKEEGCNNPVKDSGVCGKHKNRERRKKHNDAIAQYLERVMGDV